VSDTPEEIETEQTPEEVSDTSAEPTDATSVEEVSDTTDTAEAEQAPEEVSDTSSEPTDATSVEEVSDTKKTRSRRHVPRTERRQRTKPVREKPKTRKPITRTEKPESEPGRRQERRGIVVSDKGDKTIVVKVDVIKSHAKYKKVVRRSVKFHAHDEQNTAGVGDTVRIVETRPLSKQKRWRLAEVVERAR
jgi:small subunit ribosomal protein S17